jgi:hypothetical protein
VRKLRGRQRVRADHGAAREVDQQGAVGGDRQAAVPGLLGDPAQPARRATGDEHDHGSRGLRRTEG